MYQDDKIYLGTSVKGEYLDLKRANRHGLITGATGTGKTVTLQVLSEGFSRAGVPVFCADIKGDLSGLGATGEYKDFLEKRAVEIGFRDEYTFDSFPTVFWDLFGEQGHPIRTTISEMGPLLLSRLMELNPTQEGVLNIAFKIADDEGLLLLDMKDLRRFSSIWRNGRAKSRRNTAMSRLRRSARSSASCWFLKNRAERNSLANPRSISWKSCAPIAPVAV